MKFNNYSGISRQRRWQLKKMEQGLCEICGKPQVEGSIRCKEHALSKRQYNRERVGSNPWKVGSRGKPPTAKVKG